MRTCLPCSVSYPTDPFAISELQNSRIVSSALHEIRRSKGSVGIASFGPNDRKRKKLPLLNYEEGEAEVELLSALGRQAN